MATFTCAGKDYHVPEMNFLAIERAWPFVRKATEEYDPIKGSSAAIGVIAAAMFEGEGFKREDWDIEEGLDEDASFERLIYKIKKRIAANEIGNVKDAMFQVLAEGGLQVTEGELLASLQALLAQTEGSSLGTVLDTSPNSSPQE